jgi:hypothetical protein
MTSLLAKRAPSLFGGAGDKAGLRFVFGARQPERLDALP